MAENGKTMSLLIVIPFTVETAPTAEKLCDWIFQLSGTKGHALLVASHDVHGEMCTKVSIAAEVAFETSELIVASEIQTASPVMLANHLFKFAGDYIVRHFRCPWLWLEPACVPLQSDWQEHLLLSYNAQPKRYLGGWLQYAVATENSPAKVCLSRCSVYPPDAINDLSPHCTAAMPFNLAAAPHILSRSTKSRLVHEFAYNGDPTKINPAACVLNSDKTGKLIEHLQSTLTTQPAKPVTNGSPKMSVAERMAKARAARGRVGVTQMARL